MAIEMPKHAKTSGQIGGVILTALISAYFSYRTSKTAADASVAASKVKNEAGYEVLSKTVSELQRALLDEQRYSSKLEGRLQALEWRGRADRSVPPAPVVAEPAAGLAGIGSGGSGGGGGGGAPSTAPAAAPAGGAHRPVRRAAAAVLDKASAALAPPAPRPEFKPKELPKNLDEAAQKRSAF